MDDEVHRELDEDARARGVGLATYLRDLAAARAKAVRGARIRAESRRVGQLYRERAEVSEFYDTWGAPDRDILVVPS